jgi:hypothetical protein
MTEKHLIIVSAENNPYMAWQAKLLHYSCLSRLQQKPVFIVHETGSALHADFKDIERAGGIVCSAPNYRITNHGDDYSPRNLAGTLRHAAELYPERDRLFVLCDPDMLFARRADFPVTLSGDHYSYINFERPFVEIARLKMDISRDALAAQNEELRCGGPYVIPSSVAAAFAEVWLEAVEALPPRQWEDVMYAFGLAAVKLGLRITPTHLMQSNYWPDAPLTADVIHYCYGDDTWNKRQFFTEAQAPQVWMPTVSAPGDTILGEILSQIVEAREFYQSL